MSEKRVSVRLVATGADSFRAELRNLGQEGVRALGLIEAAGPRAAAGLQEARVATGEAARQLDEIAERSIRAAEALRAMGGASTEMVERIDRLTGVSGGLARDAADIEAYGQSLDDLQARFSPVFAAQLQHRRQVAEINEAHRVGAISADELAAAIVRSRAAMEAATQAARAREAALMGVVEQETLLARINRVTGVTGGVARDAEDIEAYGQALDDLRARFNPVFAAHQKYRQGLAEIEQAHRVGALNDEEFLAAKDRQARALQWTLAQLEEVDDSMGEAGRSTQYLSHRMANLSFQLQDIGVSLAGGMNPFVVMAQQGSQIAQIYGFGGGGVNALMRDLGGMVRTVGVAIGSVVARFPALTATVATLGLALVGIREEVEALGVQAPGFFETARATVEVLAERIRDLLAPAFQLLQPVFEAVSGWFTSVMSAIWEAAKTAVNGIVNAFRIGFASVKLVWEGLPDAIGALVISAANVTIRGVNSLVDRVTTIINDFLQGLNDRLANLERFTGIDLPQIDLLTVNPFDELDNPFADRTKARLDAYLAEVDRIVKSDPVGEFLADVAQRIEDNRAALQGAQQASGAAGSAIDKAADMAASGWAAVAEALGEYAAQALDWADGISDALVNAFRSAEEAFVGWIRNGKVEFSEFVNSIIADLARVGFRRFVLGPLASALAGVLGGSGFGGALAGALQHDGGRAGAGRPLMIDTSLLMAAPRLHQGGGWLGPDEYPAVLQRGERVLNRAQTREWEGGGGAVVNIYARDAESFRASRAQIGADIVRAIAFGRRSV